MIQYRKGSKDEIANIYLSFADEFPINERKTMAELRTLMDNGAYHLIIAEEALEDAFEETTQRIGFAFVYMPENANFVWLDYLVIEKNHQSKGYGSRFFNYLLQLTPYLKYMFMEVEIPNGLDINQIRRVQYYERLGAVKYPLDYLLPIPEGSIPMSLYLSKLESAEPLQMSEVLEIIRHAHGYIHWEHSHLTQLFERISNSIQ